MKKCILIGALAALMLFAFTACEPQIAGIGSYDGKTVIGVELVDAKYYAGDNVAASGDVVNVNLLYSDGSKSQTVAGLLNVGTGTTAVAGTINAGSNAVSINVAGSDNAFYTTVEGIAVENLVITTSTSTKTELKKTDITAQAMNPAGVTAEIVYADGTAVPATNVSYKYNGTSENNFYDSTAVTATYAGTQSNVKYTADGKDITVEAYKIEVTDYDATPVVDDIAIYYSVNGAEASTTLGTVYYGDVVTVSVWTVDAEDEKIENISDFDVVSGEWKNSVTVGDQDSNVWDATIVYDNNGTAITKTAHVGKGNDYVTAVTSVSIKESEKINMTASKSSFAGTEFTVMGTTKKGGSTPVDVTAQVTLTMAFADQRIPADAEVNDKVPVFVYVAYGNATPQAKEFHKVEVTVVAQGTQSGSLI